MLRLVAEGHDAEGMAKKLAYSERTITNVLHEVMTRFQLRNRSHAVAYLVRADGEAMAKRLAAERTFALISRLGLADS